MVHQESKSNREPVLAIALAVVVLWMARILAIDIGLATYIPHWSRLPLQFSLALGPLIYFYVLKLTRPEYKFKWKDVLHFSPLLLELGAQVLEVKQIIRTGAATYDTPTFQQLNPVLQLLAFISVSIYLYQSHKLIERFYQRMKFNNVSDRYRYQLRWLHRLLAGFSLLWLLWITLYSCRLLLPIRHIYVLSIVSPFNDNDHLDGGRSPFKSKRLAYRQIQYRSLNHCYRRS